MALVVEQVHADQHPGIHLPDVFVDAFGAVTGVHQIEGGAHHVAGIEQVDQLGGHDADGGQDIALGHPGSPQGGSGLFDVDEQGGVGDVIVVVHKGALGQMALVLAADVVKGRAIGCGHIPVFGVVGGKPGHCLGRIDRLLGDRHKVPLSSVLFCGVCAGRRAKGRQRARRSHYTVCRRGKSIQTGCPLAAYKGQYSRNI